jgi:hypothetical protein
MHPPMMGKEVIALRTTDPLAAVYQAACQIHAPDRSVRSPPVMGGVHAGALRADVNGRRFPTAITPLSKHGRTIRFHLAPPCPNSFGPGSPAEPTPISSYRHT